MLQQQTHSPMHNEALLLLHYTQIPLHQSALPTSLACGETPSSTPLVTPPPPH